MTTPKVRLVALSVPAIPEAQTAEELVAYCARVSNPSNQANHGTAPRLLQYLADHHHWSPFEMAHAVLEIETTRDIARQILRHRSFSFQEFSQRYADVSAMGPADTLNLRECRLQDTTNRQSSHSTNDEALQHWWREAQAKSLNLTQELYDQALEFGIAKEVARAVLPEGLTPSRLYMAGNLRSWIHYLQLRTANGTQREHQVIAEQCRQVLVQALPTFEHLLQPGEGH